jgi:hypothetical protein
MAAQASPYRTSKLYAVLAIAGAVVGLVGNALHPHTVADAATAMRPIAERSSWVGIHLAIIVAILFVIGGLVGLAQQLEEGSSGPLARVGLAAALIGGAVVTVSTAIDGFVMKALALAWASAPAGEAATALRLAAGVKDVNFGIWSTGMLVFFGTAFVCFGAAICLGRQFPAWYGWMALAGGAGSAVAALLQIAHTGQVQAAETLFLASSLLITCWAFALGVFLWRAPAAVPSPTAGQTPATAFA